MTFLSQYKEKYVSKRGSLLFRMWLFSKHFLFFGCKKLKDWNFLFSRHVEYVCIHFIKFELDSTICFRLRGKNVKPLKVDEFMDWPFNIIAYNSTFMEVQGFCDILILDSNSLSLKYYIFLYLTVLLDTALSFNIQTFWDQHLWNPFKNKVTLI